MKMKSINTKLFVAIAFMAFVTLSCGKQEQKETASEQARISAKVVEANLGKQPLVHCFSGNLEADKKSDLSTRLMGQVSRVYVKSGQHVNAGQLLLQIRNQDISAKKAQIEANKEEAVTAFNSAEKDYKRYEALYSSKSASEKEMDDMRTRYQMAKARLASVGQMEKEVDENMHYSSICAPYSGIITGKFVNEGDMANPGMPLLSMESPSKWKVIARIPEADIAKVSLNDTVNIEFKTAKTTLKGTVVEISPSTENTGNQYKVKVLVDIPDDCSEKLYSGMYANVLFEYGSKQMILVPEHSLVHRGQLTGIYAVGQEGNALLRWVRTGKKYGDKVEILSGLSDGEKYVESADSKIFNGALVASN